MDVPDLGSMSVISDAGGAAVGVWQSAGNPGIQVVAEPGTPNWFELMARDYGTSVRFYEDVFGWDTAVAGDTDEFRYTTLGEGDQQQAGIMDASGFLPEGVPAHWGIYWGVEDPDAFIARASRARRPRWCSLPRTRPTGGLATLTDPTGAMFRIIRPPQG